jgi:dephospho-CoA kinase
MFYGARIETMTIVGLTGGIGTGKSTIAAMFKKRGAYIIDYDELARVVVEPDKPAWKDIVEFFGASILKPDRAIDRAKVGEIVFADKRKRKILESFIYPRLGEEYARRIQDIEEKDPEAIIIADVPLLIETSMQGMFEKVIVVYAPREQQLQRLIDRDGFARESALKRLDAQMPIEEKVKCADFVIHNTGSPEEAEAEVDEVWKTLNTLKKGQSAPDRLPT